MSKFIDLAGQKFGKLTPIKFIGINKNRKSLWSCRCDCGNKIITTGNSLRTKHTKSCGCLNIEKIKLRTTKHGQTKNNKLSKIYCIWKNIIQRCNNPQNKAYKNYGARGIKVCYRWSNKNSKGFENFYKDVGDRPKGKSLDRINNEKGYFPDNWKWSTSKEQQRNIRTNRMETFNNKTQCRSAWAEEYNINYSTFRARLDVWRWPIEKALMTPVNKRNINE